MKKITFVVLLSFLSIGCGFIDPHTAWLEEYEKQRSAEMRAIETQIPANPMSMELEKCIDVFNALDQSDDRSIANNSNSPNAGDSVLVEQAVKGKISVENVVCRDAVAYLLSKVKHLHGGFCIDEKYESGGKMICHIAYLVKIAFPEGYRYLILEYNFWTQTYSFLNEPLYDFLKRTRVASFSIKEH